MDGQQNNAIQPIDEAWFDLAMECGKDFELPHVSTPLNPQWSDKGNLVFPEDQQPDVLERGDACDEVDSFPLVEMVPSTANSVSTVDPQEGISLANQMVHFPKIHQVVFVPTPSINSSPIESSSAYSSSFGPTGSPPVDNPEIRSSIISPSFLPNGSRVLTYLHGVSANADINPRPNPLQFVNHGTQITSDVYIEVESEGNIYSYFS